MIASEQLFIATRKITLLGYFQKAIVLGGPSTRGCHSRRGVSHSVSGHGTNMVKMLDCVGACLPKITHYGNLASGSA